MDYTIRFIGAPGEFGPDIHTVHAGDISMGDGYIGYRQGRRVTYIPEHRLHSVTYEIAPHVEPHVHTYETAFPAIPSIIRMPRDPFLTDDLYDGELESLAAQDPEEEL